MAIIKPARRPAGARGRPGGGGGGRGCRRRRGHWPRAARRAARPSRGATRRARCRLLPADPRHRPQRHPPRPLLHSLLHPPRNGAGACAIHRGALPVKPCNACLPSRPGAQDACPQLGGEHPHRAGERAPLGRLGSSDACTYQARGRSLRRRPHMLTRSPSPRPSPALPQEEKVTRHAPSPAAYAAQRHNIQDRKHPRSHSSGLHPITGVYVDPRKVRAAGAERGSGWRRIPRLRARVLTLAPCPFPTSSPRRRRMPCRRRPL
jgi:hypothetical protein